MNSRVVGISKFESPQVSGRGRDLGLHFSEGEEGLTLERWLSALVADESNADSVSNSRWNNRHSMVSPPRRVRANLEQLAAELDQEYLELAAT